MTCVVRPQGTVSGCRRLLLRVDVPSFEETVSFAAFPLLPTETFFNLQIVWGDDPVLQANLLSAFVTASSADSGCFHTRLNRVVPGNETQSLFSPGEKDKTSGSCMYNAAVFLSLLCSFVTPVVACKVARLWKTVPHNARSF